MGHKDGALLTSLCDGEETHGRINEVMKVQFDLKRSAVQHKQEVSCVNVTGVNRNTGDSRTVRQLC